MNPFKIVLADTIQDGNSVPVATAHSINLNFDNYGGMPGGEGNGLSDGNFSISGKQTLLLADNTQMEANLPHFSIRLKELETLIPNLTGDAKAEAQAKFDIWNTCLTTIQGALDTALKSQYLRDQQVAGGFYEWNQQVEGGQA